MADKTFPPFTSGQRDFILSRLADGQKYKEIISAFKSEYPHLIAPFEGTDVDKILYDRMKLLKSRKSEELETWASSEQQGTDSEVNEEMPLVPLADAYYQLKFLNDLAENTPAESVVSEGTDSNGKPFKKYRSNRADIVKIVELMRKIVVDMVSVDDKKIKSALLKLRPAGVLGKSQQNNIPSDTSDK